jgi:hypothetical protein
VEATCFDDGNKRRVWPQAHRLSCKWNIERRSEIIVDILRRQFLVPAKYAHALSDSIPFHIQLSSTLDTLKELLSPSDLRPKQAARKQGVSAFRVYIARQIVTEIHGKTSFQTLHIGSGTVRPVPPADFDSEARTRYPCLDWEGEVKCFEKIKTGGFDIGTLLVRVRGVDMLTGLT